MSDADVVRTYLKTRARDANELYESRHNPNESDEATEHSSSFLDFVSNEMLLLDNMSDEEILEIQKNKTYRSTIDTYNYAIANIGPVPSKNSNRLSSGRTSRDALDGQIIEKDLSTNDEDVARLTEEAEKTFSAAFATGATIDKEISKEKVAKNFEESLKSFIVSEDVPDETPPALKAAEQTIIGYIEEDVRLSSLPQNLRDAEISQRFDGSETKFYQEALNQREAVITLEGLIENIRKDILSGSYKDENNKKVKTPKTVNETIRYYESLLAKNENKIQSTSWYRDDAPSGSEKKARLEKEVNSYKTIKNIVENLLSTLRENQSLSPSEFASKINYEIGNDFIKSQFYNPLGPRFFLLKDLIPSQIPGIASKAEPETHEQTAKSFIGNINTLISRESSESLEDNFKKHIKLAYEHTQKVLKDNKVSSLTLYRGNSDKELNLKSREETQGVSAEWSMRGMSGWSANIVVAKNYSGDPGATIYRTRLGDDEVPKPGSLQDMSLNAQKYSTVMRADVPAEQIMFPPNLDGRESYVYVLGPSLPVRVFEGKQSRRIRGAEDRLSSGASLADAFEEPVNATQEEASALGSSLETLTGKKVAQRVVQKIQETTGKELTEKQKNTIEDIVPGLTMEIAGKTLLDVNIDDAFSETGRQLLESISIDISSDGIPFVSADPIPQLAEQIPDKRDWRTVELPKRDDVTAILEEALRDTVTLRDNTWLDSDGNIIARKAIKDDASVLEYESEEARQRFPLLEVVAPKGYVIGSDSIGLGSLNQGTLPGKYEEAWEKHGVFLRELARRAGEAMGDEEFFLPGSRINHNTSTYLRGYIGGLTDPSKFNMGISGKAEQFHHDLFGHLGTGRGFDRHGEWANDIAMMSMVDHPDSPLTPEEKMAVKHLHYLMYSDNRMFRIGRLDEPEDKLDFGDPGWSARNALEITPTNTGATTRETRVYAGDFNKVIEKLDAVSTGGRLSSGRKPLYEADIQDVETAIAHDVLGIDERKTNNRLSSDRPLIPMRRPIEPEVTRPLSPGKVYKYGQKNPDGKEIRKTNPKWLKGLSSEQIAEVLVPESKEQMFEMWIDDFVGTMPIDEKTRKSLEDYFNDAYKEYTDFNPEHIKAMRELIRESLDSNRKMKWAFEEHGAPMFHTMSPSGAELYESNPRIVELLNRLKEMRGTGERPYVRGVASPMLDSVYMNPRAVIDMEPVERGADRLGRLMDSSRSIAADDAHIDNSLQGTIIHEWGHWLHYRMLRDIEYVSSANRKYYGSGDINDDRYMRAWDVAERYNTTGIIDSNRMALHESGVPFSENDEIPRLTTSYGHVNMKEAIAEGVVAVLHPNDEMRNTQINKKLRNDVQSLLGIDEDKNPWDTPSRLSSGKEEEESRQEISSETSSTVSDSPVETIESLEFDPLEQLSGGMERLFGMPKPSDSLRKQKYSLPVYEVNGEKIAFGTKTVGKFEPEIDYGDIKVVPVNPYVISGKSEKSEEGRKLAELWILATSAMNSRTTERDPERNAGYTSALLYAASRGDSRALSELESLAEEARKEIKDSIDARQKEALEFKNYPNNPDADGNFSWEKEYRDVMVTYEQDGFSRKQRPISMDDLFVVHQTSYMPEKDENGNYIIKPLEEFEQTAESGEKITVHRGTVHMSLNHLAGGHLFRPSPTGETYVIMVPLSALLERNPDSVDNIYAVDSFFTPPPGEGLVIPADLGDIQKLPSFADMDYTPPTGTPFEWSTEEQNKNREMFLRLTEEHREKVASLLKELGKKHNESDSYETLIFQEGESSSSPGVDRRLREMSVEMGVPSRDHNSHALASYELVQPGSDELYRSVGRISTRDMSEMSKNARLRLANNDRFTTGSTKTISTSKARLYSGKDSHTPKWDSVDDIVDFKALGVADYRDQEERNEMIKESISSDWAQWDPCREIRMVAYGLAGIEDYEDVDPNIYQTGGFFGNSKFATATDPAKRMEQARLIMGMVVDSLINQARYERQPYLYRAMTFASPEEAEEFFNAMKPGNQVDIPLLAFSNVGPSSGGEHFLTKFGDDVLIELVEFPGSYETGGQFEPVYTGRHESDTLYNLNEFADNILADIESGMIDDEESVQFEKQFAERLQQLVEEYENTKDPLAKIRIRKELKDELEEHGVENIPLQWSGVPLPEDDEEYYSSMEDLDSEMVPREFISGGRLEVVDVKEDPSGLYKQIITLRQIGAFDPEEKGALVLKKEEE